MISLAYSALFKRKVALDIQVNNIVKTYSDAVVDKFNLKIDFNITKTMGSLGDRGTITITGLPLDDAGALSTCMMNIGKEAPPRNFVQLVSRKLPLLNGLYKVQTLVMQGGNRSTPYFCNVFAIRM